MEQVLSELQSISAAWLAAKQSGEKRFSLGCFDPTYRRYFPVGIVRRGGSIIAFANLWLSGEKEELSPDLMRYRPGASSAAMDYLFVRLMLWGKQEGYQWFNLGMLSLAELVIYAQAPLWHRLRALLFRHGEHFYNFQGLWQYKAKFDPIWEQT